jgi:hypothetical protein
MKRTTLSQMGGPMPGYVTINMFVEIEPNAFIIRHTHPGIESSYVPESGLDLPIQRSANPQLESRRWLPSTSRNAACRRQERRQQTRLAITYVVENSKPLVTPVTD